MNTEDKNYEYYKKEEKDLIKKYPNQFIVICKEEVVFHDENLNKVIDFARELEAGTYIIQNCETDEVDKVQAFHTRVTF